MTVDRSRETLEASCVSNAPQTMDSVWHSCG